MTNAEDFEAVRCIKYTGGFIVCGKVWKYMEKVISIVGAGGKTTLVHKLAREYHRSGKGVLVTTTTHMYVEADTDLSCDFFALRDKIIKDGYCMAVQEQKKTGMHMWQSSVWQKKPEKNSGSLHNTVETEDYYMFAVADQPYLKSQSVIKLIDKALENKGNMRLVFSLRCGDTVGNQCVFHSSLIPQLLSLDGDKGGRSVAKKYDCVYVDIADERELMDIDNLSNSKHTVTL